MKEIIYDVPKDVQDAVTKILNRFSMEVFPLNEEQSLNMRMDLALTHVNFCKIDFEKLLNANKATFLHDIYGIFSHLDRDTVTLRNCFLPRCAIKNSVKC